MGYITAPQMLYRLDRVDFQSISGLFLAHRFVSEKPFA